MKKSNNKKNDTFVHNNSTSSRKNYFRSYYNDHARHRFKNALIKIAPFKRDLKT